MNRTIITLLSSDKNERGDLANRINGLCLAIGKIVRHYKKESDVPKPLPDDAHVILIEKAAHDHAED